MSSPGARAGGLKLTSEGGLLGKLTKMVVEGALWMLWMVLLDIGLQACGRRRAMP